MKRSSIFVTIICAYALLTAGCKSSKNSCSEAYQEHADTVIIKMVKYDSIWQHDSIYLYEKTIDDTVYVEKYVERIKYKDVSRIDTVYKALTDTLYEEKIVEVEKDFTWWQKAKMILGEILLVAVIVAIGILTYKLKHKD